MSNRLSPTIEIAEHRANAIDAGDSYPTPKGPRHLHRLAGAIAVKTGGGAAIEGVVDVLTETKGVMPGYRLEKKALPNVAILRAPDSETPLHKTNAGLVRTTAVKAATSSQIALVAPVFVDPESGLLMIPTGEIIIALAPGVVPSTYFGGDWSLVKPLLGTTNQFLLDVAGSNAEGILAEVAARTADPRVVWAEPNFLLEVLKLAAPNDTYYPEQWHLHNTGQGGGTVDADPDLQEAWDITTGSSDIVVAIIDDGVQTSHPDLSANVFVNTDEVLNGLDDDGNGLADDINGWDFVGDLVESDNDPSPDVADDNHGTACAGVAASVGNNSLGTAGSAYSCKILPVKVVRGDVFLHGENMADAIRYAAGVNGTGVSSWRGADVLSISLGFSQTTAVNSALSDATSMGRNGKGCPVFVATGNYASGYVPYSLGGFNGGTHTIRWEFTKNGSGAGGADAVWIDDIVFPGGSVENFEGATFPPSGWTTGSPAWTSDSASSYVRQVAGGSKSARSGITGNNELSYLQTMRTVGIGELFFYAWTSSNPGYFVEISQGIGNYQIEGPIYTGVHDERTQVIYYASEIGDSVSLEKLRLYVSTIPGIPLANWTIRMKHTTLTEFSATPNWDTGWTVVYQNNETISTTGWHTFNFTTPFAYDGVNNLMIDFSFNNAGVSGTAGLVLGFDAGTNRTILGVSNSTSGDPLTWSGTSPSPILYNYVPWLELESGDGFRLRVDDHVYRTGAGVPVVSTPVSYPASHPDTIAVGASTNFDLRADYSQYGIQLDFLSPSSGGSLDVYTTDRTGASGYVAGDYDSHFGGTSSACPLAAGIGALLLSSNSELTAHAVRTILQSTCDQIGNVSYPGLWNTFYGYGRINANAALRSLAKVQAATVPQPNLTLDTTHDTEPEKLSVLKFQISDPGYDGRPLLVDQLRVSLSGTAGDAGNDIAWAELRDSSSRVGLATTIIDSEIVFGSTPDSDSIGDLDTIANGTAVEYTVYIYFNTSVLAQNGETYVFDIDETGVSVDTGTSTNMWRDSMAIVPVEGTVLADATPPTVEDVVVFDGYNIDVTFDEPMGTGVSVASNYAISGTGVGTLATNPDAVANITGDTYRLTWSSGEMFHGGDITITVSGVSDVAGNAIGAGNSETDTGGALGTPPTVLVDSTAPSPTGAAPIPFSITFSESVNDFNVNDLSVTNGTPDNFSGTGTFYSVDVTPSALGPVSVSVAAGVAHDAAGNVNDAGTPAMRTFIVPATVAFTQEEYSCGGQLGVTLYDYDLRSAGTATVTITTTSGDSESIVLNESPAGSGNFSVYVLLWTAPATVGNGLIELFDNELITVSYADADDGTGNPATVDDTATTICYDFGDAPTPFPTFLADNGARHALGSGLYLGTAPPDGELDGLPSPDALTGDGLDDIDGAALSGYLVVGKTSDVEVTSSAPGYIDGWIDFNDDSDWSDPGEQVFASYPVIAGINSAQIAVPSTAVATDMTFTRLRVSSAGGLSYAGAASDGEVEDYGVPIRAAASVTFGQDTYTCGTDVTIDLYDWDLFNAATQSVAVTTTAGDSETFDLNEDAVDRRLFHGNCPTAPGLPIPGDGVLQFEHGETLTVTYDDLDDGTGHPETVEDTASTECFDYGDAPDPTYPTLFATDGARHGIGSGLYLGLLAPDGEVDGQPDPAALEEPEDDGVALDGIGIAWVAGSTKEVEITSSGTGKLDMWVDWNADGDWADAGEQVLSNVDVTAGTNLVNVAVPPAAVVDQITFTRVRLSGSGGLSYTGAADDGEVEDYISVVYAEPDISATPGTFSFGVFPGANETQLLDIENTTAGGPFGSANLDVSLTALSDGASIEWEEFGIDSAVVAGSNRYRGNVYQATSDVFLTQVEANLDFTGGATLEFVIFESDTNFGVYTQIANEQVVQTGTGSAFYSSGPIRVPLQSGKYYVIATGWGATNVGYHYQVSDTPVPGAFVTMFDGFASDAYPIPSSLTRSAAANFYHQRLTTTDSWLTAAPLEGSVPAGDVLPADITADAHFLGVGDYAGSVTITSNDPDENPLVLPVSLTINQPPPDIDLLLSSLSFTQLETEIHDQPLEVANVAPVGADELRIVVSTSTPGATELTEYVGSGNQSVDNVSVLYRGNVILADRNSVITSVESYLDFAGERTLEFVVLESATYGGTFNVIARQQVTRLGAGPAFYASDALSVPTRSGYWYVVATGWASPAIDYAYDPVVSPWDLDFGQVTGGFLHYSFPMGPTAVIAASSNSIYQRVTTSDTWLAATVPANVLTAGSNVTMSVRADAGELEPGVYDGTVDVANNDPDENPISVPVTLTVDAATIGVTVAPSDWPIGPLALGAVVESPRFDVLNTGNVLEDIYISGSILPGRWQFGATPGMDTFVVDVDQGDDGSYGATPLTETEQLIKDALPINTLWPLGLRYRAPTGDTFGGGVAQDFDVTIRASKAVVE